MVSLIRNNGIQITGHPVPIDKNIQEDPIISVVLDEPYEYLKIIRNEGEALKIYINGSEDYILMDGLHMQSFILEDFHISSFTIEDQIDGTEKHFQYILMK